MSVRIVYLENTKRALPSFLAELYRNLAESCLSEHGGVCTVEAQGIIATFEDDDDAMMFILNNPQFRERIVA